MNRHLTAILILGTIAGCSKSPTNQVSTAAKTQAQSTAAEKLTQSTTIELKEDQQVSIQETVEIDGLDRILKTSPSHGHLKTCDSVSDKTQNCIYVPDLNFHGKDQLVFEYFKNNIKVKELTVNLKITPVIDRPYFNVTKKQVTTTAGSSRVIDLPAPLAPDSKKISVHITSDIPRSTSLECKLAQTKIRCILSTPYDFQGDYPIRLQISDEYQRTSKPFNLVVKVTDAPDQDGDSIPDEMETEGEIHIARPPKPKVALTGKLTFENLNYSYDANQTLSPNKLYGEQLILLSEKRYIQNLPIDLKTSSDEIIAGSMLPKIPLNLDLVRHIDRIDHDLSSTRSAQLKLKAHMDFESIQQAKFVSNIRYQVLAIAPGTSRIINLTKNTPSCTDDCVVHEPLDMKKSTKVSVTKSLTIDRATFSWIAKNRAYIVFAIKDFTIKGEWRTRKAKHVLEQIKKKNIKIVTFDQLRGQRERYLLRKGLNSQRIKAFIGERVESNAGQLVSVTAKGENLASTLDIDLSDQANSSLNRWFTLGDQNWEHQINFNELMFVHTNVTKMIEAKLQLKQVEQYSGRGTIRKHILVRKSARAFLVQSSVLLEQQVDRRAIDVNASVEVEKCPSSDRSPQPCRTVRKPGLCGVWWTYPGKVTQTRVNTNKSWVNMYITISNQNKHVKTYPSISDTVRRTHDLGTVPNGLLSVTVPNLNYTKILGYDGDRACGHRGKGRNFDSNPKLLKHPKTLIKTHHADVRVYAY